MRWHRAARDRQDTGGLRAPEEATSTTPLPAQNLVTIDDSTREAPCICISIGVSGNPVQFCAVNRTIEDYRSIQHQGEGLLTAVRR